MGGGSSRYSVRKRLDEILSKPLGEQEAAEYDRERWGLSEEAVLAAQTKDALWGDMTYN